MTSPSRRKHQTTVPALPPAARLFSLAGWSAREGVKKPRWQAWLEAAAVAATLVGAPAFARADDLAPPARFLEAPDAQPLAAPQSGPSLAAPRNDAIVGPSLGNDWTPVGRKSARPAAKAEFASHHSNPSALKPTTGTLQWRSKNASLGHSLPPGEVSTPDHSVKAGAWNDVPSRAAAPPRNVPEAVSASPLADPFEDQAVPKSSLVQKTPSKLELPDFPAGKSVLSEDAPAETNFEPSAAVKPRGVVKFQPRTRPTEPENAPEPDETGPVRNIWEGGNCDKNKKDCATYVERLKENKLSRYTKTFLDISPNAPSEDRNEVPISKKAEILAKMEDRVWTNSKGQKVAEGRWTDYRYGRIEVTGAMPAMLSVDDLSQDDQCLIALAWSLPIECDPHFGEYNGRSFMPSTFTWTASALCHKPLYFEQVQVERYGHTAGPLVEPFAAGAHFFVNIAILPYRMGINPPGECLYSLGYYRPGSCAPWMVPAFPLSLRGAAVQTGAVFGVHAMMP